ncbi:MAG: hypothetical protein ACXVBF_12145 [Flavisolibacter sp.]
MQLLDSLFEIVDGGEDTTGFTSTIKFFPGHVIFKGHFPGHPVTPGVIFLQLVHELVEMHLNKSIRLVGLSTCKFLRAVNPEFEEIAQISVSIKAKDDLLNVKALGKNETGTIFKLEADYRPLSK